MDRFWDGLNHDIQDILMHEEYYSITRMFLLACKAEQKIQRRFHKTSTCKKTAANFSTPPPTAIEVSRDFQVSSPTVPSTSETDLHGNSKGTTFLSPHEPYACPTELKTSCVQLSTWVTPTVEDYVADLKLPCDQLHEIPTVLSDSVVEINASTDLSAPMELNVEDETCDFIAKSDLDYIQLVTRHEELTRISQTNSLFCIDMHPQIGRAHV